MLKIDFFPPDMVKEYENQIAEEIKKRNGNKNEIRFIPDMEYTISIHDLLTADRKKILAIDGIPLYMSICASQKYITTEVGELLHALSLKHSDKVNRIGRYKYNVDGIIYNSRTRKNEQIAIDKAINLIKSEFPSPYAKFIDGSSTLMELSNALKKMYDYLISANFNNKQSKLIIDYSILKGDIRHKILNSLGLRTCPYCNRNYITSYGEKSTADLDHFYQKKQYPLFALSLFNFVPSCSVCNSRMKNIHPADDALYPYEEGFEDDARFELKTTRKPYEKNFCESTVHLFQAIRDTKFDEFSLEIITDPKTPFSKKKKIENSEKLFHLKEVYANHKQDALEAAFRTRVYCEGNYKRHCQRLLKRLEQAGMKMTAFVDLEASMFADIIDYEWLMFGIFFNDEKRRYEKPLSKMIYDIYKSGKE